MASVSAKNKVLEAVMSAQMEYGGVKKGLIRFPNNTVLPVEGPLTSLRGFQCSLPKLNGDRRIQTRGGIPIYLSLTLVFSHMSDILSC